MVKLLAVLALAAPLFAGPLVCGPDFVTDGRTVDPACAGIAAQVYADPGARFLFSFEDIRFGEQATDGDYNDFFATLTVNASGASALVTFGGALAGRWNTLLLNDVPLFVSNVNQPGDSVTVATAPWAVIPFQLASFGFTDAGRIHTWIYDMGTIQDYAVCLTPDKCVPASVPEPREALVVGAVLLVGFGVFVARRKAS